MGDWIFAALPVAAALHIFEEYVYPGGFAALLKNLLPRATHLFTPSFHVAVNGLFFLLCLSSALVGTANLVFSLSVFSLIFANAVLHIRGAVVTKGYYPDVISGVLIYIPLAIYAYSRFLITGQLSWPHGGLSVLLGVLYMAALMGYVLSQQAGKAG